MKDKEFLLLAQKISDGSATDQEIALYNSLINNISNNNQDWNHEMGDRKEIKEELFSMIKSQIHIPANTRNYNALYWRVSIAATILIVLSFSLLYKSDKHSEVPNSNQKTVEDVKPGGNKAILTLSDGSRIILDSISNGEVVNNGGVSISKTADGELKYVISNIKSSSEKLAYNTIETPVGGQYQIVLPDGTKVWLNSASSIKYPVVFKGNKRKVELIGEAYFEVTHVLNSKKELIPFIVRNNLQQIEVLGTHFNVNGYLDDETIKTTLLEGSVRILPLGSQSGKFLKPGQQAVVQNGGINIQIADTESAIAWKNGDFIFNQEKLQSVMKKIARWYNVEVIYQGIQNEPKFSGVVARSRNLSDVLKMMELTGEVKFKIEGRKVFVKG